MIKLINANIIPISVIIAGSAIGFLCGNIAVGFAISVLFVALVTIFC